MADRTTDGRDQLLARVRELEAQLLSQETLDDLIQELHVHQEELRSQQDALTDVQRELEASRDRYAELYDFTPVPIISVGENGVIRSLNLAAARLIGFDRASAAGMPLLVYVHPDSRRTYIEHLRRARAQADLVVSEIAVRGGEGRRVHVELYSKRFESSSEKGPILQSVLVDLTERRRAQEERERSHREELAARAQNEAKDRFLAVLSHELRTPLTPILLTLEMLEGDERGATAELRGGLRLVRRNAETLARLIDDLLDVTRIAHDKLSLDKKPVSLHPELQAVAETCAAELARNAVTLDLELAPEAIFVRADALRVRQIFWNLVRNAIRHSPAGTRVALRSERVGARSVRVTVHDSGPGIDPREAERLFEPFQQARDERSSPGLGLGLAICKGLTEAHGGSIHVANPGAANGAAFVVELPICPAPRAAPPPREPAGRVESEPLRILVVEDHLDTAQAMKVVLGRLGYRVRLANSLEEGRELAREPFDVLISDVQLPDGSGLDLMRELSRGHPVKGIAMSGFGTEEDVRRSRAAGFQCHLVKPVDVQRVADAIAALPRD